MKTYHSVDSTVSAILDAGVLRVFKTEQALRIITSEHTEVATLTGLAPGTAGHRLLSALQRAPLFAVGFHAGTQYNADVSAGMQRWRGEITGRQLSRQLRQLEFSSDQVHEIMTEMRKHPDTYVPRVG